MHYQIFEIVVYFFSWTLLLYWLHRLAHRSKFLNKFHFHHHKFVIKNNTGWKLNNLLLFNDDWPSTIDLWLSEVIPTLIFSLITGQWWISIFYYLWAALLQESLEHNKNVNLLFFTFGKWHLTHHYRPNKNFGLFFPVWDIIFRTNVNVHK